MIYTIIRLLNKLCVKKLLSMNSYFDYVVKEYYPQIVDSAIYEAFV